MRDALDELMQMPSDLDTICAVERALLGAVLTDQAKTLPPLRVREFFLDKHQTMWSAMLDLVEADGRADLVSLNQRLREINETIEPVYLAQCMEEAFASTNMMGYARQIRDSYSRREMQKIASQMMLQGLDHAQVLAKLDEMPGPMVPALYDAGDHWHRIVERWTQPDARLLTGLWQLDQQSQGLTLGELVVIGGRTSHGKTAFAKMLARRVAQAGHAVDYLTLEETAEAMTRRLLAEIATVKTMDIKFGPLDQERFVACEAAVATLQGLPLRITALDTIRSLDEDTIVGLAATSTAPLVIIDHLQKINTRGDSRQYGLERVMNRMHAVTIKHERSVVVLSQLNRNMETEKSRPQLSHLRDSGATEMAARQVWLLYWPWKVDEVENPADLYEVDVAKNSDGGTGRVKLHFAAAYGQFEDWEPKPTTESWFEPAAEAHA